MTVLRAHIIQAGIQTSCHLSFYPPYSVHTYCLRGKFPTVKIGGKNPTLISDVSAHWRCCSYITAPRGKQSLKRTVIRGRFCWTELQTVSSFVDRWPEVRICRGFQAEGFASGAWKEWDGMNGYQGLGRNKVVGTIRAKIICPHVTRKSSKDTNRLTPVLLKAVSLCPWLP